MTCGASPCWFTAAEIAALALPGFPSSKRGVNAIAAAEGWGARVGGDGSALARARFGRGGGTEYHASLFPEGIQELLRSRAPLVPIAANDAAMPVAEQWAWFDQQPASIRDKAGKRLAILSEIDMLVAASMPKGAAIGSVARRHGIGKTQIFEWYKAVGEVRPADRLPFLAPRYQGGGREAVIDAEAWRIIKTDYLRPEKPSFATCYRRLLDDYATPRGIALPTMKTLQRRMDREISATLKTAKRDGREASRRAVPPQRRTVMDLHAMQAVNVDGHTFDVFVQWEDGRIGRPVMVGLQDVFSRKLLAHRIGETECTLLTRMAFADLFRDYGIPADAVMDNGRAFASKALTGGALTRFRFKIKDTDATGVLTALGIRTHWTMPYRGSSKPIERAWRDLCDDIAKHPTVAGAYTGNRPDAKPENYRERAIPIADFRAHVARRIAAHNARAGRRTEAAQGDSFDATFAASYAVAPIGRATPEAMRMALLVAEDRKCDRENGSVTLAGNRYWSADMIELAGKVVTVRFDPDNLHSEVHVYQRSGEYLGRAAVIEATGFFDKAGSVRRGKLEADVRRKVRAAEDAAELLRVDQLAELLSGSPDPAPLPSPAVVRPVRHRGSSAAALKPVQQAEPAPAVPAFLDAFGAAVDRRLRVVE